MSQQNSRTSASSKPGKAHVDHYENQAQFPSAPLYSVDEIVYVSVSNQAQPEGPLVIEAIEGNMYRLKWLSNGAEYHCLTPEDCLVVPSS